MRSHEDALLQRKGNDLINPDEQATNSRAAVEQANWGRGQRRRSAAGGG